MRSCFTKTLSCQDLLHFKLSRVILVLLFSMNLGSVLYSKPSLNILISYIPTAAPDLFTSFTPLCSIIYQTHQTKYSSVQYSMKRAIHSHLSLLLTEHSYLKSCGIKIILFIKLLLS